MKINSMFAAASLAIAAAALYSCSGSKNSGGYRIAENGAEYVIYQDAEGPTAQVGDLLVMHMILRNSTDSILRNTYTEGQAFQYLVAESPFKGSADAALTLFSKGDSGTFLVLADSMFLKYGQPLPPEILPGSKLSFQVKIEDIKSAEQMKKEQEEMMKNQNQAAAAQIQTDEEIISKYLTENNIKAERYESGLYYQKTKDGKGESPKQGNMLSVHYTGMLMNGTKFDSSVDRGQPFSFQVGVGQVIRGWDEGLMKMKVGEKGTLFIPSGMAYGPQGSGQLIPPNSVLKFEVELLGISEQP